MKCLYVAGTMTMTMTFDSVVCAQAPSFGVYRRNVTREPHANRTARDLGGKILT